VHTPLLYGNDQTTPFVTSACQTPTGTAQSVLSCRLLGYPRT